MYILYDRQHSSIVLLTPKSKISLFVSGLKVTLHTSDSKKFFHKTQ